MNEGSIASRESSKNSRAIASSPRGRVLDSFANVTGPSNRGESTLAVTRGKADRHLDADIIDLVQLPRGTRPTPIAYLDYDEVQSRRQMDCDYYHSCLSFAARVRWKSFHCRQCPQHPDRADHVVETVDEPSVEAAIIEFR